GAHPRCAARRPRHALPLHALGAPAADHRDRHDARWHVPHRGRGDRAPGEELPLHPVVPRGARCDPRSGEGPAPLRVGGVEHRRAARSRASARHVHLHREHAVLMIGSERSAPPSTSTTARPTIAILDYGSQYTQLIARRVRESRVYCEIFPHDVTADELARKNVVGVILSGGPASVYEKDAPLIEPRILDGRFPVLGICDGMHLMAHVLGGEVAPEGKREFGPATVEIQDASGLFEGLAASERAWMSHGDTVKRLPPGFHGIASTDRLPLAAMSD